MDRPLILMRGVPNLFDHSMKKPSFNLTIATRNPGKLREIGAFFEGLPMTIKGLKDHPSVGPVGETGSTFVGNAVLKAKAVHAMTGGYVLADDSGLVCEDLKGAPGIYSSRYAGPAANDDDNNRKLLQEIFAADDPSRRATYVCALCLIDPSGGETIVEEKCDGMITLTPGGKGGFGYDPYFFLPEFDCTMAELPLEKKNKVSHRGKALAKILSLLKEQVKGHL